MMRYLSHMNPARLAFLASALMSSAAMAADPTNAASATASTNAVSVAATNTASATATNAMPVASTNIAAATPSRGSDRSSRSQATAGVASDSIASISASARMEGLSFRATRRRNRPSRGAARPC